jgi:hypothetical protein
MNKKFKNPTLILQSRKIAIPKEQMAPARFTYYWFAVQRWEGQDFLVEIPEEAIS